MAENNKKKVFKNSKVLYILGWVLLALFLVFLIVAICCAFLMTDYLKESNWFGIFLVVLIVVAAIGCFFSIYLLKKADYVKVNNDSDEEAKKAIKETEEKLNEKEQELNDYKNKNDN